MPAHLLLKELVRIITIGVQRVNIRFLILCSFVLTSSVLFIIMYSIIGYNVLSCTDVISLPLKFQVPSLIYLL